MDVLVDGTRLREALLYAPESGAFVWKISRGKATPGKVAGTLGTHGYLRIKLDGHIYDAHRLAWFYAFGAWPDGEIDHVDGSRTNNRLSNLRIASSSQNKANGKRRCTNTSGFKGVRWHTQRKRWNARITVNRRAISLGMYDDQASAHEAYCRAAKRFFGEFARAA